MEKNRESEKKYNKINEPSLFVKLVEALVYAVVDTP